MSFAFIETLIAKQIATKTLDTDEVRIHYREGNTDNIVAGMTSGKPVGNNETNENNSNNGIRIWAGTELDATSNYTLNLSNAPFKVT